VPYLRTREREDPARTIHADIHLRRVFGVLNKEVAEHIATKQEQYERWAKRNKGRSNIDGSFDANFKMRLRNLRGCSGEGCDSLKECPCEQLRE